MRIVFTGAAEADFESIGDFIAADNPLRAVSFVQELRQACEGLASFRANFRWRGISRAAGFADEAIAATPSSIEWRKIGSSSCASSTARASWTTRASLLRAGVERRLGILSPELPAGASRNS